MSLSEQNSRRRENISQRPRNNYSWTNCREWIPRGSAPAVQTFVPSSSVDSSKQNENGNGAVPVSMSATVVPNGNKNHVASRGNPSRFFSRRDKKEKKDKGKFNREENSKTVKGVSIPQLVQEIQDKLLKGSVECMICYDMVRSIVT
ncbi:hypothetical protein OROGR_009476 [Orobanche gracilis]